MIAARRAFTLVEVLVVLAILAVVAAVSVPALMAVTVRGSTDEAAARVHGMLRAARDEALARGRASRVTIDARRAIVWQRDPDRTSVLALPGDCRLSGGSERLHVRFFPGGTAAGDVITVRCSDGTATVAPDPWSGEMHTGGGR